FVLFFFSSRRRHTSFSRDWSSDVCSSDLNLNLAPSNFDQFSVLAPVDSRLGSRSGQTISGFYDVNNASKAIATNNSTILVKDLRSEERRVGKECRSEWARGGGRKKKKNSR